MMLIVFLVAALVAALEIRWQAFSKIVAMERDLWREIWK